MGMVVGHELTHGFDDQGRQFDAEGNLKDWWTPASGQAFVERADCVKKQFDGYVAVDDLHLNGALTLGENVADLGGLKLAYAAMEAYAQQHPDRVVRGTPLHRRRSSSSSATPRRGAPTPGRRSSGCWPGPIPHSPPRYRVNGPLSNLPQFQQAFQCKAGDKMVSQNRCTVW